MKVAVQIRAHQVTAKVRDLVAQLQGSDRFDVFVSFDATKGSPDLPGVPVVEFTQPKFAAMGLPIARHMPVGQFMWTFCDFTLYQLRQLHPGYDYYVAVEYDVDFVGGGRAFLHDLIDRLIRDGEAAPDLAAVFLAPSVESWSWYRGAARRFPAVHSCHFGFGVYSGRGLDHLYQQRLAEAAAPEPAEGYVQSEAFVASGLGSDPRFRCVALERFMPGCLDVETFRFGGLPYLMGHLPAVPAAIRLLHPVLDETKFVRRHYFAALGNGTLPAYVAWLNEGDGRFASPALRRQYTRKARLMSLAPGAWRMAERIARRIPGLRALRKAILPQ